MYLHCTGSTTRSLFGGRRYRATFKIIATDAEYRAIHEHGLGRLEITHDPVRDDFYKRAEAAHERHKALPICYLPETPLQAAAIAGQHWLELSRQLALLARASLSFRVTVNDLVAGTSIMHRNINAIVEIKAILSKSVHAINSTVAAALEFQHGFENVLSTEAADDGTTPPNDWPAAW